MRSAFSCKLTGVKEAMEMYDPKLVKKAIRSTLDKTGTFAKQRIVGSVSSEYYVKPKNIRDAITVKRTTAAEFKTELLIRGMKLQLYKYFSAFQHATGISANVSRSHTMNIPHAFIQTARRGNNPGWKGAMIRKTRKRYPTKSLPGPAIPELVNKLWSSIEDKVAAFMQKLFFQEIEKRIKGGGQK